MNPPRLLHRREVLGTGLAGGIVLGLGAGWGRGAGAQALPVPPHPTEPGAFDAADFGFDVRANAAANAGALMAALQAAGGRPVIVSAATDFVMDRVDLPAGLPADLRFQGPGRLDKTDGTQALTAGHPCQAVQPIHAFDVVEMQIDGSQSTVTRLTVPDSSAYARGDVVRVASDDIDPDADPTPPRRRGEYAVVAEVEDGVIHLAGRLEDEGLYLSAPRLGLLPDIPFRLTGLRIRSRLDSRAVLLVIGPCRRAEIEVEAMEHGRIVLDLLGCYQSVTRMAGSGKGDAQGSLGYLVNDVSGFANHHVAPRGRFFRHVVTAGFNTAEPGSDLLHLHGANRDMLVTDGIAHGCQGASWDTHPGARRSIFRNCLAAAALDNRSSARCAVQIRGRDTVVDGLRADDSHVAAIRFNSDTVGTVTIRNMVARCPAFQLSPNTKSANPGLTDVWLVDSDVSPDTAQSVVEDLGSAVCIHIHGGRLAMRRPTNDKAQIISARGQSRWDLDNVEMVFGGGPASGLRFLRAADSASVTGSAGMRIMGDARVDQIWLADRGAPVLMMKAIWRQGSMPRPLVGEWGQAYYAIRAPDDPGPGSTNVKDFATWATTLGTLD